MLVCIGDCPDTDEACAGDCFTEGSLEGQQDYTSLADCFNGCTSTAADGGWYCISASCADDSATCYHERTGSSSCSGIVDCFVACPEGNQACVDSCFDAGLSGEIFSRSGRITQIQVGIPRETIR